MLRAALIGLLWNAVADDESCAGDCEADGDPFAVCSAMRALGWGQHFDARTFERRAVEERLPCEACKQPAVRVRCDNCLRDLCERCLARATCAHDDKGVHREAAR